MRHFFVRFKNDDVLILTLRPFFYIKVGKKDRHLKQIREGVRNILLFGHI